MLHSDGSGTRACADNTYDNILKSVGITGEGCKTLPDLSGDGSLGVTICLCTGNLCNRA